MLSSKSALQKNQIDFEPEVELISLTSEILPHYKLRSDYSVRFSGYQNCDFNRAEQVKEDITELTNDQIHQTLEYFIICGLRVNKMSETYEDCAALTLLVQEQRSHLDLAANIGLNLVEKNTQLEKRVISLEEQLEGSKETIKQIKHQLFLKDDLLEMFHNEMQDSEDQSCQQTELECMERLAIKSIQSSPLSTIKGSGDHDNICPDNEFILGKVSVRQLEIKLSKLEDENSKLREQQQNINTHTDLLESKETQLVNDCVSHILESTTTIDRLSMELNKKTNDYLNQHEEISHLLTSKIDLENKTHYLLSENDNLITQLSDHQTKEFTLTKEITEMRDRYDECINLLNEKQDEIRRLKKMNKREMIKHAQYFYPPTQDLDMSLSLASELEQSCKRGEEEIEHCRTLRIMEQARVLNNSSMEGDDETSSSGFTEDLCSSSLVNLESELEVAEEFTGNFLLRRSIQDDCQRRRLLKRHEQSSLPYRSDCYSSSGTLTPQSNNTDNTESQLSTEALYHHKSSSSGLNSLNRNIISRNDSPSFSHNPYKYPDKLQLVKPLEGSQTLRAWQNLATPSLTKTLFEDQPHGVCFRGQNFSGISEQSSPDSDKSQEHTRLSSDFDDIDFEEPAAIVKTKPLKFHSIPDSYSKSTMSNNDISVIVKPMNLQTSLRKEESVSPFSLSINSNSKHILQRNINSSESFDNNIGTSSKHNKEVFQGDNTHNHQPSSWLNKLTVGNIMTSVLGYTRPLSSAAFITNTPFKHAYVPPVTNGSVSETSLIGRLTNLPPLAKRKPPQKSQTGLNLLTSLAAPSSSTESIFSRVNSFDKDDSQNNSLTQID